MQQKIIIHFQGAAEKVSIHLSEADDTRGMVDNGILLGILKIKYTYGWESTIPELYKSIEIPA